MFGDFNTLDSDDDVIRRECPHCGKGFDVAGGNEFSDDGVICPYCGAEIES